MGFMDEYYKALKDDSTKSNSSGSGSSGGGKSSGSSFMDEYNKAVGTTNRSNSKASVYTRDIAPLSDRIASRMTVRNKKKKKKEEEERSWFKKGLFEDGYDIGDISRTILGSTADVLENVGSGIIGMGEKAVDAMAYIAPYAANGQFYQNGGIYTLEQQKHQEKVIEESKKEMGKFIAKDLYDEEKVARAIISDPARKIGIDSETQSVFGEKSDALIQSGGQLLATAGLQAVGVPWFVTTGVTSYGSEVENAMNQDASYEAAGASAAISAGAEILSEKLSGGISFGGKTLDDALTKQLARGISNKLGRTAAKLGLDMAGEGAEEVFSQIASNLGSSLYKEEDITELLFNEEAMDGYLESFIGGAALGGVAGSYNAVKSSKQGVDYASGLTQNEQKVVDKLYQDEIASREKEGKVTEKEKSKIYDSILEDMEKGYISTDTIEEVLGGEKYSQYKQAADWENSLQTEFDQLNKMKQGDMTGEQVDRREALRTQIQNVKATSSQAQLRSQIRDEVMGLVKGDRLAESYNERARTGQKFEADVTKYDAKQQAVVQKAIDSGILNNSNRTHEFVDFVSKISADTGVLFDFSNTAKIREAGFAVEGQTVDGFITKDGITVNIDSPKSRQFVVGHEITHALEGTELYDALRKSVFDYAKMKNQYGVRMESIQKRYKEGTDYEAELTADLVGEYIFSDTDFINNLSTQNRNVFQKVFDEIKYLCKVATAGSKEARELEKVKRAFEKAYREGGKVQGETKYSLTDTQDKAYQSAVESGELGKAQSLVDNRAYTSGYNIKLHHGTAGEPFYVFRQGAEGIHFGTLEQATERAEITAHRYGYGETDYTTGEIRKNLGLFPNGARRKIIEDIAFDGDVDLTAEEQDIVDSIMDRGGDISDETLIRFIDKVENEHGEMNFSLTNRVMQKDSGKRVISAYVKAKKPLVFSLDIGEWTPYQIADLFIKKINGETAEVYDLDSHRFVKRDPADITGIELTAEDIPDLQRLMQSSDFADMAQFLQDKGYDCIRYLNTYEGTKSEESYILLSPEQVKSADTVTYDDSGNVVPLSQRFNAENNDIRYSLSEVTEEQNQKGLDRRSEVTYSLSNDTAYMDKAIAKNNSMMKVDSTVLEETKALRGRIAARMNAIKDRGLVGLPEDIEGNTYIANSSYDGTEENTTICPRSLASEAFVDAVSEYLGRPLSVNEQIYISQDLQGRSLTPECTYCYVATDRKAYRAFLGEYVAQRDTVLRKVQENPNADVSRSGELYKEFLNGRKDTKPMYGRFKMWVDAYKNGKPMIDASHLANINKLMGDINSEFGAELKPQIVDAMKYAQSASWAKKRVNYVAYNGHILNWKQDRINKLNSHYGLRMYSFSDFHPAFVLENMQMITDASVRGLKMLGYTKDTDFVDIFAPSGMNINVSTFGFEAGGEVFENNLIGAEWEKAKALREQYPNVGITFVATNDTLVNWALNQDWIDVVIPYHLVRTGAEVAKAFNYTNYTSESSDTKTKDWKKGDQKYIAPTEHNNDKATYLDALAKNHLKPRFERFIDNPNYMKLVNECRQPASMSKPVQPVFNEDAAMVALAKLEANGYYQPIGGSVDRMYEIAGEVADAMTNELAPAMSLSNVGEQHTADSLSALRYDAPVSETNIAPTVSETESVPVEAPIYESNDKNAPEGQTAMFEPVEEEKKQTRKEYHRSIIDNIKSRFKAKGLDFDKVLKGAKNLSTWSTVDNTPQRVMEKALGYKEGGILADITVNKVAQNETDGIKWLNDYVKQLKQISKQYGIKPGSKESAAAQMFAEGFFVNENNEIVRYGEPELIQDFGDADVRRRIKGLARDPRIRKIYDDTLASINEARARNLYPEIPRLDNYFLHFRAMEDTFSTLGLPFNPNDIRAKDLPTDLNGVTADLKPGQPFFSSAMHRTGKRTSFDLLGGVERYLNSAKSQIYHIDDIQTLRALRNYIAETYGQATGLEDIDSLTDAEAEERIKQVYDSHLSTFAKFLNEEANVLAGKTALIDRGIEGIIGRRGITFLNALNKQVGSNMVGYNVSSSLTNFLPVVQTFAKTNKFDFTKAFAQTVANKLSGGRFDSFAEDSPVVIRRKGEDRFYRTPWQKMADPGYALMGMVDDISTEIIARTKYNEFIRKGMDSQKAHFETDKWVSKLMGDRSLGQQPQLYNSKMLGLVTKFQLEVRNQLDSQFYDTIQETKVSNEHIQNGLARNAKTAAKVASVFTQLAVAQHLYGMAFESMAGYNPAFDIIEVLMTAFGFDDEEDSEDTLKDNLGQGFEAFMEDLPYASIITGGGRIPISSALPIKEFFKGEDQYGNEKSRWETLGEVAPYYLMPGGYGQVKKTTQGLKMFSEDHPIAGSYTDAGNLRYDVEDTAGSRIKAGIFGQYASENAKKYFDQEQRTLNPEQTAIFAGLGIPIEEYWEYRDNLYAFYDVRDALKEAAYADGATDEDVLRYTYINNIYGDIYDLYDKQKEIAGTDSASKKGELQKLQKQMEQMLSESKYGVDSMKLTGAYAEVGGVRYNKDADSGRWYEIKPKNADGSDNWYYQKEQEVTKGLGVSYEEYWNNREEYNFAYDKPGKYAIAQAVGGYDSYMEHYDVLENWQSDNYLGADKDSKGNSISGSRKKKVVEYINSLDADYGEKIILYRTVYTSKADKRAYNQDIIDYLNEREDISYQQMKSILEELDMEVDSNGNITW